jgi:hypothetical protein
MALAHNHIMTTWQSRLFFGPVNPGHEYVSPELKSGSVKPEERYLTGVRRIISRAASHMPVTTRTMEFPYTYIDLRWERMVLKRMLMAQWGAQSSEPPILRIMAQLAILNIASPL